MADLKRFDMMLHYDGGEMVQFDDGDYCLYSDAEAQDKENATLRAENEALAEKVQEVKDRAADTNLAASLSRMELTRVYTEELAQARGDVLLMDALEENPSLLNLAGFHAAERALLEHGVRRGLQVLMGPTVRASTESSGGGEGEKGG